MYKSFEKMAGKQTILEQDLHPSATTQKRVNFLSESIMEWIFDCDKRTSQFIGLWGSGGTIFCGTNIIVEQKKLKEEKKKGVDNEIITKAKYKHKHTNLLQPSVGLHTILFNTSAPGFRFQH
jgi:hypothetical protein